MSDYDHLRDEAPADMSMRASSESAKTRMSFYRLREDVPPFAFADGRKIDHETRVASHDSVRVMHPAWFACASEDDE